MDNAAKVKNVVHLWEREKAEKMLQRVRLAAGGANPMQEEETETPSITFGDLTVCDKMFCASCSVEFEDRTEQKDHFKSDWHRFNLKLKLKGKPCVTESVFDDITQAGDLSSISGSENSSDEDTDEHYDKIERYDVTKNEIGDVSEMGDHIEGIGQRHPRIFLRNIQGELISVYRCLIHGKKKQVESSEVLLDLVSNLPGQTVWAVFLIAGGHFAGAVFDGNEVIKSKTFHRYVIRAKRGTVQSTKDTKGHAPKSAGASLRRHNEAALAQEIQDLIMSWGDQLKLCTRIFLRVPPYHKSIVFGGKVPALDRSDARIRSIPFPTRRPTFKEVRRVHEQLSSIECYGSYSQLTDHIISHSPKKVGRSTDLQKHAAGQVVTMETSQQPDELCPSKNIAQDDSDSSIDMVMTEEIVVMDTSELQPFGHTEAKPKSKKQRKKKKEQSDNKKAESGDNLGLPVTSDDLDMSPLELEMSAEERELRDQLYTFCRASDAGQIESTINDYLHRHKGEPLSKHLQVEPNITMEDASHDSKSDGLVSGGNEVPSERKQTEPNITMEVTSSNISHDSKFHGLVSSGNEVPSERNQAEPNITMEVTSSNISKSGGSVSSGKEVPSESVEVKEPEVVCRVKSVLNAPLGNHGLSLLHVTAERGYEEGIVVLMTHGADPSIKDGQGRLPYSVACNKNTRNAFRRFMAKYPDMYDYNQAQIPSPLTEEQEQKKKARDSERNKASKKSKKLRLKEQKEEASKLEAEENEKKKYLSLSDREKRALAAEKRLQAQKETAAATCPPASRCYQCGVDMSGRVPFEYSFYKFCTTQCLREHRLKPADVTMVTKPS